MYQAADNLHARLTHELSKHVELLELVEAAQAAGIVTVVRTWPESSSFRGNLLLIVTYMLCHCGSALDSCQVLGHPTASSHLHA
jgi:hypothetical protein